MLKSSNKIIVGPKVKENLKTFFEMKNTVSYKEKIS